MDIIIDDLMEQVERLLVRIAVLEEISCKKCALCQKAFEKPNEYGLCRCRCSNCNILYRDCKLKCYLNKN